MKNGFMGLVLVWAISGSLLAAPVDGEWTGTISCGELQNSPNAKNKAPFTGAETLTIHKNSATLDRSWPAGKEHLEGTVSRGQPLKLEGQGWFYGKEAYAWKVRLKLFEIGQRYEGEGVIESVDGLTKYRDCKVSVESAIAPTQTLTPSAGKVATEAPKTLSKSEPAHPVNLVAPKSASQSNAQAPVAQPTSSTELATDKRSTNGSPPNVTASEPTQATPPSQPVETSAPIAGPTSSPVVVAPVASTPGSMKSNATSSGLFSLGANVVTLLGGMIVAIAGLLGYQRLRKSQPVEFLPHQWSDKANSPETMPPGSTDNLQKVKYGVCILIVVAIMGVIGNYWVRSARQKDNGDQAAQIKSTDLDSHPKDQEKQSCTYGPKPVTLNGRLNWVSGETPDGETIKIPVLHLDKKINVIGSTDDPTESEVDQLQVFMSDSDRLIYKNIANSELSVTGTIFHAVTSHHHTKVLINATSIASQNKAQQKAEENSQSIGNDSYRSGAGSVETTLKGGLYLKVNVAYECKIPSQRAVINRIFLDDGRFGEQWFSAADLSSANTVVVGRWRTTSDVEGAQYLILSETVMVDTGTRKSLDSVRVSEVITEPKLHDARQLNFSAKDGVSAIMTCNEMDGSSQGTEHAASNMRKMTDDLWRDTKNRRASVKTREENAALCTSTHDASKAEQEAIVARVTVMRKIATARRSGGFCGTTATINAEEIVQRTDNNIAKLLAKPDAGIWNAYCKTYVVASEVLDNLCK